MEPCEFCVAPAKWRFWPVSETIRAIHGDRFSCADHIAWLRRLMYLDLGNVRYTWAAVEETEVRRRAPEREPDGR